MSDASVVCEKLPVPQVRYHAALHSGIERVCAKLGKHALRERMDLSRTGLDNILNGTSVPSEKRLWDLLPDDESVLDDLADLYNKQIVPKGAICDISLRAAPALVAALHKVIEGEADGTLDHNELLAMERELIDAEQTIHRLRARISDIRKPREVA